MRTTTSIVVALFGSLVMGASQVAAFHTPFLYRVDRFEEDGNVLGPADGVPDVVDDFAASPLGPLWYQAYGTVSEADGYLRLTNPGFHFPAPPDASSPSGSLLDLSVAASASPTWVFDGLGDFTGTAYWEGVIPDVNHHYHFSVYTFGGQSGYYAETFGLAIRRTDTAVEIEQHLTEIDQWTGIYQNTQLLFHEIDPADLTGQLVFRITFHDVTNEATTAFSLDGGTTWQSPFPPGVIFQGRTQAQFLLSADPWAAGAVVTSTTVTVTTSTTTTTLPGGPCVPTGCRLSTQPLKSKLALKDKSSDTADLLSWKWKKGDFTNLADLGQPVGGATTYWFCLGDGLGNNVFEVAIPPGGLCSGGNCWQQTGSGFTFTDSAATNGGVRKLILRGGGFGKASVVLKAKGVNLDLPAMPLELPVTARLSNSLGQCWAEIFGTTGLIKNDAGQFTGKSGSP
jgi:hypothetical protein